MARRRKSTRPKRLQQRPVSITPPVPSRIRRSKIKIRPRDLKPRDRIKIGKSVGRLPHYEFTLSRKALSRPPARGKAKSGATKTSKK